MQRLQFVICLLTCAMLGQRAIAQEQPVSVSLDARQQLFEQLAVDAKQFDARNILKKVVRVAKPSVVHIQSRKLVQTGSRRTLEEAGSGFVVEIKDQKYILTNRHVVFPTVADGVKISLEDGQTLSVLDITSDPASDIAVITVREAGLLVPARIGDSGRMDIGDFVVAIGSPFGLTHSITYGIISAKGRKDLALGTQGVVIQDFIQTDAAINPGNSGGPLVNLRGEIVGVNSAIYSRSGGYQGIGFAVPINMAQRIMDDLINKGTVSRGWLGVGIQDVTQDLAQAFNLENAKGSLITGVMRETPADRGGLQRGDVVIELNGEEILNSRQFRNEIANAGAGSDIEMKVVRNTKIMYFTINLDERPKELGRVSMKPDKSKENAFGFSVTNISQDDVNKLNLESSNGVLIGEVKPGSLASKEGLAAGMVIQEINRRPIKSVSDFNQIMTESSSEKGILLLVVSDGNARYVNLKQQE